MKNNKGIAPILIILLIVGVLGLVGGAYYFLVKKTPQPVTCTQEAKICPDGSSVSRTGPNCEFAQCPTENSSTNTELAENSATNTPCDNYQCLISAASQCQPISVTISYSGILFPLNPDMSVSGQTKYEIKKSSGVNDCILTISFPVASLTISDKGRKAALAQGMTDAQITAQLQTMNDSLKSIAGMQTTCASNASIITAYLTDSENNLKNGNFQFGVNGDLSGATTTYTLSSGQKLICTNRQ